MKLADDVAELVAALVRDNPDPRIDTIALEVSRGVMSCLDGALAAIRVLAERDVAPNSATAGATVLS